jgi:Homeobox KN domain
MFFSGEWGDAYSEPYDRYSDTYSEPYDRNDRYSEGYDEYSEVSNWRMENDDDKSVSSHVGVSTPIGSCSEKIEDHCEILLDDSTPISSWRKTWETLRTYEKKSEVKKNEQQNTKKKPHNQRVTRVLKKWMELNIDSPYPNKNQKNELVAQTKLSFHQINVWFVNARRRKMKKENDDDESISSQIPAGCPNKPHAKRVTRVLKEWMQLNIDSPFPNKDQKKELMAQTKLSLRQINVWFFNARKRNIEK